MSMERTDVLILSAGAVAQDLASVFGSIPSGLIPINNKPAIAWIIDGLLDQGFGRFIVTTGFKRELLEQFLQHAYATRGDLSCTAVDYRLPPGNAILDALQHVRSEDLLVILGDTIVQEDIVLDGSFVLTSSQFTDPTKWCLTRADAAGFLEQLVDKQDVMETAELRALIGVYYFKDVRILSATTRDLDRTQRLEISALLERYRAEDPIRCIEERGWVDIGHLDRYHQAKILLARPRAFNQLEHDPVRGIIWKRSVNHDKLRDELQWYRELPDDLKILTPRVLDGYVDGDSSIAMEYYGYPTLAELFVHGVIHPTIWRQILEKVMAVVQLFLAHPGEVTRDDYEAMYVRKTRERIARAVEQNADLRALTGFQTLVINDRPCRSIDALMPFVEAMVGTLYGDSALYNCFLHGDLCFSNILYDTASGVIRLIDPRGRWGQTPYGDIRYDLAKLRHSVVGHYDFIMNDRFTVERDGASLTVDIHAGSAQRTIASHFDALLARSWNLDQVAFIEGLLFLSMIPLHTERKERQLAMFATGLERLNAVYERVGQLVHV